MWRGFVGSGQQCGGYGGTVGVSAGRERVEVGVGWSEGGSGRWRVVGRWGWDSEEQGRGRGAGGCRLHVGFRRKMQWRNVLWEGDVIGGNYWWRET